MDITPEEYGKLVKQKSKKSPIVKDTVLAFVIGGLICVIGQLITNGWAAAGLGKEDAGTAASCSLVFLSALLTGLNLYNKLGLQTRWWRRPWSSRARGSSPAWRPKCFWWPGR